MTTIVYDHVKRQIAVDSRSTSGGIIKSDTRKKWRLIDGALWFFAGAHCDIDDFLAASIDGVKPSRELDCIAMLVENSQVFWRGVDNSDGAPWRQPVDCSDAVGSGQSFALSALDFGKSAKEAVEYAMTRDIYTGGTVHVYDIEKGEFV